jgi:cell division control protein 7
MVEGGQKLGACLHTCASPEHPHGRILTSSEYDRQAVRKAQKDAREKSRLSTEKVGYPEKDTRYVTCGASRQPI